MKYKKRIFATLVLVTLLLFCLVINTSTVFAQDGGGDEGEDDGSQASGFDDAIEPVTDLVKDIAMSIIKFLTFIGGVIFVLTVVIGAAKGTLGSALGNRMQVSSSLMALLMGGGSLLLMLLAVPLANNLLEMLVDRLLVDEAMNIPNIVEMAGAEGIQASTNPEELLQIPALQEMITDISITIIRVVITIVTIAFVVAVAFGALDTQIGTLLGGGQMVSQGLTRIIGSVAGVIFLILSFPLSKWMLSALVPKILPSITISTPFG
jgi:hypothetical protein